MINSLTLQPKLIFLYEVQLQTPVCIFTLSHMETKIKSVKACCN